MKLSITKPKGDAFCRSCYEPYQWRREGMQKKDSLRGKDSLRIETHTAGGRSVSFYCMKCAKTIQFALEDLLK
jgi:hypothetical protein